MPNKLIPIFIAGVMLAFMAKASQADDQMTFPSDAEIQSAQHQSRDVLDSLPDANTIQQQYGRVGIPNIERVPAPNPTPPVDIADMAKEYQNSTNTQLASQTKYDLLILASLSMPKEALTRLAEQARRAKATFVFRGFSGNTITRMTRDAHAAMGNVQASIVINPTAFKQFSVTEVPAIVIATHQAGNVLESGCAKPQTYVKVSGDVSLDYALDYIERTSPQWESAAREFRSGIVKGLE
jgi:conjugal transfer pilus assembly protein TrbC